MTEGVCLIRVCDGTIVYANPTFEKMFGYGHGELFGKNISVVNAPTEKSTEEIAKDIQRSLKKTGVWSGEVYNIKKDGAPFWCYANVSTFGHPEYGKVWVAVHTDITERKRAKLILQESEATYRTLIETTDTGYLIFNVQGQVVDANAEYVRLTGHKTLQEILGRSVLEWTAPHDLQRNATEIDKCIKTCIVRNLEIDYIDKNGVFTPIEINANVIKTEKGTRILSLCRDITERKQAEEQLQERLQELEIYYKSTIGREGRIIELKQQVNELLVQLGKEKKYDL
ncbi:PAS domain-containing protein [bacterium]|nr:PAS domain-containing protein [bacterium]MBU1875336.1 PAS domain-containing protein [bacterium]